MKTTIKRIAVPLLFLGHLPHPVKAATPSITSLERRVENLEKSMFTKADAEKMRLESKADAEKIRQESKADMAAMNFENRIFSSSMLLTSSIFPYLAYRRELEKDRRELAEKEQNKKSFKTDLRNLFSYFND